MSLYCLVKSFGDMPLPTLPHDTDSLNGYIKINCSNSSILFPKFLIFESFTPLKCKGGSLELFTLQRKVWFVTVFIIRVVTKISSCRVFVVSRRESRTQSWSPPPPKKFLKCNFHRFPKSITAPNKQLSSRVELSLAVLL